MSGKEPEGRRAERRHLTALFSDLSDSTALASSVDPEEFAELLEQLNRTFEQIIHRHGGTILQVRGDGVFAVFGMEAREDESRRATEAALELHDAVRNIAFHSPMPGFSRLTMHSGIHSGLVLAVEGDQILGRFVLVGDAANLASRLSDAAAADEILVSDASLGPERAFFETGPMREFRFEGIEEPLVVYPVTGRTGIGTRFEARTVGKPTPMVGRERELSILRQVFKACEDGEARTVSIVSEPGLGKTRLVEEFFRELEGSDCLVLRSYCESYLNAEPLQPVLQMVRQLLDLPQALHEAGDNLPDIIERRLTTLAPHLAGEAAVIAAMLSPSQAPRPEETAILTTVANIAQAIAMQRPLVVFIDDWQWADDSTRSTLRSTPELGQIGLLLIRCSREPIPASQSSQVIELQPLDAPHSMSLIEKLVPGADRVQIEQVRRASGGNPLFIEELCHAVERGVTTPALHERWHSAQIPNNLNMLIASRVAQLTGAQLSLLRTLAVMGNVVPGWLLGNVIDVRQMEGAIEQLAELDLVFPLDAEGSLRFKHGITRDVVLDGLSRQERQTLHRMVAEVIESRFAEGEREPVLEALAYHYGETNEHDRAADYAEAAADKALAASAMDRARLQFQAALKALNQLGTDAVYERWMGITKRLAMACLFDAEPAQCDIYRRAIELAEARDDLPNRIDAEYWLAYVNYALGEAPAAMKHIDRARALANGVVTPAHEQQILSTWGQVRANACDYGPALEALDSAMASQAPFLKHPNVATAYAYSLAAKSMVFGDMGRFDEAYECLEEAGELTRGTVQPVQGSITSMRTAVYLWQGRWEEGLVSARENMEIGDRTGSRYISAMGAALAGYARWQLEPEPDLDPMLRALNWVETTHETIWTSLHFSWLCEILVDLGRYQEARRAAVWVLRRARKLERLGESVAYCALAIVPEGAHAAGSAERCFSRARASADFRQSEREHRLIDMKEAAHLAATGQPEAAARRLEGCRDAFSRMGMYWHAAETQRLELRIHRP